jgi:hypothetical protein
MIDLDDVRLTAQMMLTRLLDYLVIRQVFRNLRFQMIDDTSRSSPATRDISTWVKE